MMIKKYSVIIFYLFLFISLEAVSYLILPDSKLNTFESILNILDEDSRLLWRQRPFLSTKFQGALVKTNSFGFRNKELQVKKPQGTYRIICLGASPTFGWGVEYVKTYPFVLEQKLKKAYKQDVEVINAGQIGYTTYQGIILLEKYLLKYSPDLVTVSYVLNDIDRYRFYRNEGLSDKELINPSFLRIKVNNILSKSRFYVLLKRFIFSLMHRNDKLAADILKKQFNLAKVRVTGNDYKANLEKIIKICAANKIKLIFVKMPINLSLPRLSDYEDGLIRKGEKLSRHYYELGQDLLNKAKFSEAAVYFKKAKDYLSLECRDDGGLYQDKMEEVASQNNIALVDIKEIFLKEAKGRDLFNGPQDPIHPNPYGHQLIAKAIYAEILKGGLFVPNNNN